MLISHTAEHALSLSVGGHSIPLPTAPTVRRHSSADAETVIELSGALEGPAALSLGETLDEAMESGTHAITVDLRSVDRINGRGAHTLLVGQLHADDLGIALSIIPGPPEVQRTLDRTDAPFSYC